MNRAVLIAMEHDGRHHLPVLPGAVHGCSLPLAHGGERGGEVAGGAAREAGMHADRGVQIGVGHAHDGGGRGSGRQPGDIDAFGIDRVVAHDLPRDAGDQRGLALAMLLVVRAEPVPAFRGVGGGGLGRIGDQAGVLLGERVHPRACGEVVGDWVQPCSMTTRGTACHDSRWGRRACSAAAGPVAVRSCQKPSAVRNDVGVRRRAPRRPPMPGSAPILSRKLRSASGICG